jgi:(heptosyl)LPS beta-1,4-glucosyltransferase
MSENGLENPYLTVIILTLNNSDTIAECIKSVSWADEVLVYDSGSSDNTASIASELGARVVMDSSWSGFGQQRQKAQTHAKGEWLLWIDSDEIVSDELKASIQLVLTNKDKKIAYSVNRVSDFFGRFIRHSGWYPDRIVRLYAREHYHYNDVLVHEKVDCPTEVVKPLQGDLLHYTSNSFWGYMSKSLRYADDWAKQKYEKGRRVTVFGIVIRTMIAFIRKYIIKRGFLDGRHGFLLALQSSHYTFNKYFALWVLNQRSAEKKSTLE